MSGCMVLGGPRAGLLACCSAAFGNCSPATPNPEDRPTGRWSSAIVSYPRRICTDPDLLLMFRFGMLIVERSEGWMARCAKLIVSDEVHPVFAVMAQPHLYA